MSWVNIPNFLIASLAALVSLPGTTSYATAQATPGNRADPASAPSGASPIASRQGRFALVELEPSVGQRDLLEQVVETDAPNSLHATVGDGLRHLLARSGYRLCESDAAATLYALPLPAAHLQLGPMTLRDALSTLAGSAWKLSVDEVARVVCFAQTVEPDRSTISAPAQDGKEAQP
jgi:conjugative transfer region protein (TIGR03748 family)